MTDDDLGAADPAPRPDDGPVLVGTPAFEGGDAVIAVVVATLTAAFLVVARRARRRRATDDGEA